MNRTAKVSALAAGGALTLWGTWHVSPSLTKRETFLPPLGTANSAQPPASLASSSTSSSPLADAHSPILDLIPPAVPMAPTPLSKDGGKPNVSSLLQSSGADLVKQLKHFHAQGSLAHISDQERSDIMRHALQTDPFQQHVRTLAQETDQEIFDQLLRENGNLLFAGRLEGQFVVLHVWLDPEPGALLWLNSTLPLPLVVERTGEGGVSIGHADPEASFAHGEVRSGTRSLLLDLSVSGVGAYRLEVWRGVELPDDAPASGIADEVQRILFGQR